MQDRQIQVARALLHTDAVGFNVEQPVTFASGLISPVYIDNRRLPFHPEHWRVVIDGFISLIQELELQFDIIAGVAVGAIPHSSVVAYESGKPSIVIRKEAKKHGKQRQIEGGEVVDQKILLIEDLVTTGMSSLNAVNLLRSENANIDHMIAIVQYGFGAAEQNFADANMTLSTLTNFAVIIQEAQVMGKLNEQSIALVEEWFEQPENWAERNGLA